jgi:cell division protein FtsL
MINITKIEFRTLLLIVIATIVLLTVNAINSDNIINRHNAEIESYEKTIDSYQDKVDSYEEELYILRSENRDNKFVIDASLINTEKINLEVEKNNLLTVD